MGKNLSFYCVLLITLSSCLPSSKFKESKQGIAECNPNIETCPEPPPTSEYSYENISVSPANSFSPIFSARLIGNLNLVSKVVLYTQKSSSTCSAPVSYNDGRNPQDGIAIDDFNGNQLSAELNLASLLANTNLKIYAKVVKTDASSSTCTYLTQYQHNLQSPIRLTSAVVDGTERTTVPLHFKNTTLTLKLSTSFADITQIKLYKNSCDSTSIADGTKADFVQGVAVGAANITANQLNKFFAKGFNNSTSVTPCIQIFSSTHDAILPVLTGAISTKYITTSRASSPEMSWPSGTDSNGSGISHYVYAIGTGTSGASVENVKGWTRTNDNSNFAVAGLSLDYDTPYYFSIKAVDAVNNESTPLVSHFWKASETDITLTITSPTNNQTVALRNLTITGTCIGGVPVVRAANSSVNAGTITCSNNDTFSMPVELFPKANDTDTTRTISLSQSDGISTITKQRTVNLNLLSDYGHQLSTSIDHSCAMRNNEMYCWGKADNGRLGLGDNATDSNVAKKISRGGWAVDTFYAHVAVGNGHTCGLNTAKKVYCWGNNNYSQVGDNDDTAQFKLPQNVSGNLTYKQITAGSRHTCGISGVFEDVYCWGHNDHRELGPNSKSGTVFYEKSAIPFLVSFPNDGNAQQIDAGRDYTCAIVKNNNEKNLYCWGRQEHGVLGNQSAEDVNRASPQRASEGLLDPGESFEYVSAGNSHTCAITNTDNLKCWGKNFNGALGFGSLNSVYTTAPEQNVLKARTVSVGGSVGDDNTNQNTCAIRKNDGKLFCWGSNSHGQLGINQAASQIDHSINPREVNVDNVTAPVNWQEVSVGALHVCARNIDDKIYCWGQKDSVVLGNSSATEPQLKPIEVNTWR